MTVEEMLKESQEKLEAERAAVAQMKAMADEFQAKYSATCAERDAVAAALADAQKALAERGEEIAALKASVAAEQERAEKAEQKLANPEFLAVSGTNAAPQDDAHEPKENENITATLLSLKGAERSRYILAHADELRELAARSK